MFSGISEAFEAQNRPINSVKINVKQFTFPFSDALRQNKLILVQSFSKTDKGPKAVILEKEDSEHFHIFGENSRIPKSSKTWSNIEETQILENFETSDFMLSYVGFSFAIGKPS